ncbi:hypothetical protein MUK42_34035 [Musa troglodytarum]|uniref:Uncharacterized protein n=1 Tax=Musa troglodytarum TaxID=320322 RepID=A0A9E7GBH4_9LILI|nr:hypothetical protein MUK42_34035 [Musa troglodytarum]
MNTAERWGGPLVHFQASRDHGGGKDSRPLKKCYVCECNLDRLQNRKHEDVVDTLFGSLCAGISWRSNFGCSGSFLLRSNLPWMGVVKSSPMNSLDMSGDA